MKSLLTVQKSSYAILCTRKSVFLHSLQCIADGFIVNVEHRPFIRCGHEATDMRPHVHGLPVSGMYPSL